MAIGLLAQTWELGASPSIGKESIMPTVDMSRVTEILEVARTILRHNRDHDLVQRVFVLQGYVQLSRMHPDRNYDDFIGRALDELTAQVHSYLHGETAEMNRQYVLPIPGLKLSQSI